METSVLDALEDIGTYNGPLLKDEEFEKAIEGGPKSKEYTELVHLLSEELKALCSLEESVNPTQGPDDASSFLLELSSFLKELGCPYLALTTGHLSSRLQIRNERLLLLDYLLSELMAARIYVINNPTRSNSMDVQIEESDTAKDIKDILSVLKLDVTPELPFSKIEAKLNENIKKVPNYVGDPVYNQKITDQQWNDLEVMYKRLADEYKMRRGMLITRLDCTIQSFEWSGKEKGKREKIHEIYRPLRSKLKETTSVKLSDILAARTSLLTLKKTSDSSVRLNTKSDVNKVIMGKVPDRGGRPSEQDAPPPEMPSWQKQRAQGGGNDRGGSARGRGGGFGGGSRVQGGWNSNSSGNSRGGGDGGRGGGGGGSNRNYQDNISTNVNENRNYQSNVNYQDNSNGRGYHNNKRGNDSHRGQSQNYQQNQGYQSYGPDQAYQYQAQAGYVQNYQNYNQNFPGSSSQGYQGQNQNQGKVRYQNEHDDRTSDYNNGGNFSRGRGKSNYHRGGW